MTSSSHRHDMEKRSYVESTERASGFSQAVVNENTLANPVYVVDCGFPISGFSLSNQSVNEGVDDSLVGNLSIDFGGLSPFSYSISTNPGNLFKISNTNELRTNAQIDFDVNPSVEISITLSDSAGRSITQDFTITINEVASQSPQETTFNGVDEYINFGSALRFQQNQAWTFSMWVTPDSVATRMGLISNNLGSGTRAGYVISTNNGALITELFNDNTTSNSIIMSSGTGILSAGTKHHVIVHYDGTGDESGIDYRVDGAGYSEFPSNNNISGTFTYTTQDFLIGAEANGSLPFDGKIDEVLVFNRKLTNTECDALYNSGTIPDATQLSTYTDCVAHFKMGEGSLAPNLEEEISGNTATMVNMDSSNFVVL